MIPLTRKPDPATLNIVYHRILQSYSLQTYGSKSLEECPIVDLLKYDYTLQNIRIEVKLRHYSHQYTDPKCYRYKDIQVEFEQHKGRPDGWFYECCADRIFYVKFLYVTSPSNPMFTERHHIKEFTFYDVSWPELKQLCVTNKYPTSYSGKSTGSLNWNVPVSDISDIRIWRHTLNA